MNKFEEGILGILSASAAKLEQEFTLNIFHVCSTIFRDTNLSNQNLQSSLEYTSFEIHRTHCAFWVTTLICNSGYRFQRVTRNVPECIPFWNTVNRTHPERQTSVTLCLPSLLKILSHLKQTKWPKHLPSRFKLHNTLSWPSSTKKRILAQRFSKLLLILFNVVQLFALPISWSIHITQ